MKKKKIRQKFKIQLIFQDPDERLTAVNTEFEWIYGHFHKAVDRWIFIATILPSMITLSICLIVHGKFDVAYLFHPIKMQ